MRDLQFVSSMYGQYLGFGRMSHVVAAATDRFWPVDREGWPVVVALWGVVDNVKGGVFVVRGCFVAEVYRQRIIEVRLIAGGMDEENQGGDSIAGRLVGIGAEH